MTDREMDALVAERVMGWIRGKPKRGEYEWYPPQRNEWERIGGRITPPEFITDMREDHKVLEHVREKWDYVGRGDFKDALYGIWEAHRSERIMPMMDLFLMYEPGDYSRAALAALGVNVSETSNKS